MARGGRRAGRAKAQPKPEKKAQGGQTSAPRRKRRGRPNSGWAVNGRAHHGHYDAFDPRKQPMARAVGHATAVRGFGRLKRPSFNDGAEQMYVFMPSTTRVVGLYGNYKTGIDQWRGAGPNVDTNTALIENMGFSEESGPHQTLLGKFSVRLRNISKAMDASGSVYVLSLNAGMFLESLNGDWTARTNWTRLRNYVLGSPRTRTFSGSELLKTRQWNTHPIDATRSQEFQMVPPATPDTQVTTFRNSLDSPTHSMVVFLFIPGESNVRNMYEFSFAANHYCRYEVNGPLANAAEPVPTAPISVIDGARKFVENVGSLGHVVEDVVGTINAYAPAGL